MSTDGNTGLTKDMFRLIKEINQHFMEQKIDIFRYHEFHERDFIYIDEKFQLNIKTKAKLAAIELNKYLGE